MVGNSQTWRWGSRNSRFVFFFFWGGGGALGRNRRGSISGRKLRDWEGRKPKFTILFLFVWGGHLLLTDGVSHGASELKSMGTRAKRRYVEEERQDSRAVQLTSTICSSATIFSNVRYIVRPSRYSRERRLHTPGTVPALKNHAANLVRDWFLATKMA